MNITILLDRSYKSLTTSQLDCSRMYTFLSEVMKRMSFRTKNKFRLGAYGSTTSFLCPITSIKKPLQTDSEKEQTDFKKEQRRTDFVYHLKSHYDTPHQVWTEDTKAELLFLLKGQPFQVQGHNNIREMLQLVTHGAPEVSADHVVIIACWPLSETPDLQNIMQQTASVSLVNLNKKSITPDKVANKLHNLSEKYLIAKKTKSRTPYEELQFSMFVFLRERAPILLEEAYGPAKTVTQSPTRLSHPCEAQGSGCSAKTCY